MGARRKYDKEFKIQALKLAKEVGPKQAATELGMPESTLSGWTYRARKGEIDTGAGSRTPEESLNLAQQLQESKKKIKELEKQIKELTELNEFLEEASAFFAASRQKSVKRKD